MEVQEPALAFLRAIEGRIPLDRLAHPGNGLLDELVEATTDGVLPPRHRRDIGLDRCVALALRDLRIAAGEQHHLLAAPKGGLLASGLLAGHLLSCRLLLRGLLLGGHRGSSVILVALLSTAGGR